MNQEKKKATAAEKKTLDKVKKKNSDKEKEDPEENPKVKTVKQKRPADTNITSTTPRATPAAKKIPEKKSFHRVAKKAETTRQTSGVSSVANTSKTNIAPTAKKPANEKKIKKWSDNPNSKEILNNFINSYQTKLNATFSYSLSKLTDLSKNIFFQNLHKIKKQTNELITLISQYNSKNSSPPLSSGESITTSSFDYAKIFLNFIESLTKKIELQNDDDQGYNTLATEPNELKIFSKGDSVSFEIPIHRKRALSSRIEQRLNRSRKSSEEITKRINEKMATAEKVKQSIKQYNIENSNKISSKITEIKQKQKKEKKEKIKKIYTKLEKMGAQQQKYMENKLNVVRKEHEKVAEINYLHSLEKENKNINLLKKLNVSIERRNKYIQDRVDKALRNDKYYSNTNGMDTERLKENLINKIEDSRGNGIEIFEKKKMVESQFEFMKKVFNENFIWELFEADYFNIDEIYNISSLTRFELLKTKLRKEKEMIDKMYENRVNKQKSKSGTANTNTVTVTETEDCDEEFFKEDDLEGNDYEDKRSRSFTFFNEDDLNDINYLFTDVKKKKNRKKKKKGKDGNPTSFSVNKDEVINEEERGMRNRLMRTINSMSQKDLRAFYNSAKKDQRIKRYLVKSKSNNKYVKSKLIITTEDISNNIKLVKGDNVAKTSPTKKEIEEINMTQAHPNPTTASQPSEKPSNSSGVSAKDSKKADKEKVFHNLIQASDLGNNNNSSTILINSNSLQNILEKNQITVRWCKICNMILPNDQDSNVHINKPEHQKIKKEYGLSIQEEANTIMVFQSIPGDINEELKNERIASIKLRVRKLRQRLSLKAVKHENFGTSKQDFPSPNKQRIQKLSFEIEKQVLPNIKDYDALENLLKDLIKILEQKKHNDLHILRQVKVIHILVEVLKKPAVCHKSEIKALGKILELIIQILTFFSTLLENRNYMIVTNRISVIADLLLWVLNKPSKIPLGISFLPDLIGLIIVHIKHRIPFEYLSMKDDTLEYIFLSNILLKFKQKYYNLSGSIYLAPGFGSFPLVLLKSLSMFEGLTMQININYLTKPVYVKHYKISENVLFLLEYSELIGMIHLLSVLLLSNGATKPKEKIPIQPKVVISASLLAVKILNNISRIDLNLVQNIANTQLNQEQLQHVIIFIINYALESMETSDDIKELLHELLLLLSYLCLNNEKFQNVVNRGEVTIIQNICALPFSYFSDKALKDILFPTLITMTYTNERNTQILSKEINLELIVMYLKEKIQLEPILEEEGDNISSSANADGKNVMKINKEMFMQGAADNEIKQRGVAYSTASSTKSCHDMVTGVSDFVTLSHRFPFDLWEKAEEYYANFGKGK